MRDYAQINQGLSQRIPDLALALGLGAATSRTATGWRYGRRGSLAIRSDGRWYCHETGEGGDLVGLVHARRECASMSQAARWAESYLGGDWRDNPVPPKPVLPPADDTARIRRALQIWEQAEPLSGTLAAQYLESRGAGFATIAAESGAVRYHPSCRFGADALPCLIALMTDPLNGTPTGIHRTGLSRDGKKIDRRMLGKAGIVRLSPNEQVTVGLGVAEGLETSLAVLANGWSPIWAPV